MRRNFNGPCYLVSANLNGVTMYNVSTYTLLRKRNLPAAKRLPVLMILAFKEVVANAK